MSNDAPNDDAPKPVWVTNVAEKEADTILREFRRIHPTHTFELSRPQRSFNFTVEQLEERNVKGIYATRISNG